MNDQIILSPTTKQAIVDEILSGVKKMFNEHQVATQDSHLPEKVNSSDARKILNGISSVTLWEWDKKGWTKPYKTPTGRKYYNRSDLKKLLVQIETKKATHL